MCVPKHACKVESNQSKYGILCGIQIGMEQVQRRLNNLQERDGHLWKKLKLMYITVTTDQESYSNTEDAQDTAFKMISKFKKASKSSFNCRHKLAS